MTRVFVLLLVLMTPAFAADNGRQEPSQAFIQWRKNITVTYEKLGYPSPAMKMGPQFYYLWTHEQCLTIEQTIVNPRGIPWEGLLAGDKMKQQEQQAILAQCRLPTITWVTEHGDVKMHHIHLYLPEQILTGFALVRYNCRQTHDQQLIKWDDAAGHHEYWNPEIDRWGEDDDFDDQERANYFSPGLCDYYNQRAKQLFEEVREPKIHSHGGAFDYTRTWDLLEFATAVVSGVDR